VAGFATGGIPEIVIDGETGRVVRQCDTQALGAAVKSLFDHSDQRRTMGERAASRAKDMFSNEAIARQFVAQYHETIAERRSESLVASS
jgi:glycosyltransferase involved in cell wall biosynthesis